MEGYEMFQWLSGNLKHATSRPLIRWPNKFK